MKKLIAIVLLVVMVQGLAEELKKPKLRTFKIDSTKLELAGFHDYHVKEFVKADGFGEMRVVILPKIIELVVDGDLYRLTDMKLLSVTDRKKAVVWEFPRSVKFSVLSTFNREKIENGHMKKRPIDDVELKDMNKLRKGNDWVLHKDQRDLRIVAPLHGGLTCIRCHEDYKVGEFMGAFIYELTAVDKMPYKNKEVKPAEKKELSKISQKK